jgi:hypothetical protein
LAIAALRLMLICEPESVWQTTDGKCSPNLPSITLRAARGMARSRRRSSAPVSG